MFYFFCVLFNMLDKKYNCFLFIQIKFLGKAKCMWPVCFLKIGRDPTRVVAYRCPGNTACQVYNYKERTARVVFGPDLVILGQHEDFNVLSLSGENCNTFCIYNFNTLDKVKL